MNRQTARLAQQESMPKKRNTLLQHTAVRPLAEPASVSNGLAAGLARDFTQVPVQPQVQIAGRNTPRSCPMSPQRCPFGGACHSCPPRVQAKLKIGQPGDKYEQEADQVAEQVMRMPEPQVQRKGCSSCKDDEDKILQTKSAGNAGNAQVDHPLIQSVLSSPGQPLDAGTRSFMEPRFGQDFSGVRVHTDGQAAEAARAVNARAYTVGRNVVFGAGEYAPGSSEGQRLVAHELVHVGQQRESKGQRIQRRHVLENDPVTAPSMTCAVATSSPAGVSLDVTFGVNSSTLSTLDKAAVSSFVRNWHLTAVAEPVRIDGYASIDGPPSLNWPLSCRRAEILANELMTPSDGSPGIPASSITLFAQGETEQFSSALEPNRRAQAHIPSVPIPPPPCPAGVKTISVDMVRLHGATQSPTAQLATANTVYRPCCVQFVAGATPPQESQADTEGWLGGDTDVDRTQGEGCGNVGGEEQVMFDSLTTKHGLSSRMRVFFVASFSPTAALAYSIPPYCATGAEAPYVDHVVILNTALTDTLAHEFGHILLNSGDHKGIVNPADTRNLMFAPGRTASDLDATQCATIFGNA